MRRKKLLIHLESSLWFVPVLCVLAGAALSFGTIAVDRYFDYQALPSDVVGGPDAAAFFRVHGDFTALDEDRLHDALILSLEPTLDEDVAYGVRLLVDIAERSLADSPFQDPTTATQAIDRLHDILRQLARRPFPDGKHHDEEGKVRLTIRTMSWEAYVHLAFDEIRLAGRGSPQVTRRLKAALMDLKSVALPERVGVLDFQLDLLSTNAQEFLEDERDVELALFEDREGIGAAASSIDGTGLPPSAERARLAQE
jgi:uncharacterized membrane protein